MNPRLLGAHLSTIKSSAAHNDPQGQLMAQINELQGQQVSPLKASLSAGVIPGGGFLHGGIGGNWKTSLSEGIGSLGLGTIGGLLAKRFGANLGARFGNHMLNNKIDPLKQQLAQMQSQPQQSGGFLSSLFGGGKSAAVNPRLFGAMLAQI